MSDGRTPGPWHTGGIFDPDGPRPTVHVWGSATPGTQSGTIVAQNCTIADAKFITKASQLAELLCALKAQLLDARNQYAIEHNKALDAEAERERVRTLLSNLVDASRALINHTSFDANFDVRAPFVKALAEAREALK